MPNPRIASTGAATLLLLAPLLASAAPVPSFAIGTGQYGMRKEVPHSLGIELQFRPPWQWAAFRPIAGLLTSTSGGAYLYSGFEIEVPLPGGLRLNPGFAPGLVLAAGDRDLGSPVEFRTSVELSASPTDRFRIGVGFSHISNAGLTDHNPGVETLMLSIAFLPGG